MNQNAKLKIEVEEVQQEKKTIMRKLVQTMLKYDKETSFSNQANLMSNTSYQPDQDYVTASAGIGIEKSK